MAAISHLDERARRVGGTVIPTIVGVLVPIAARVVQNVGFGRDVPALSIRVRHLGIVVCALAAGTSTGTCQGDDGDSVE
jgi:hypothetical protein